MKLFVFRNSTVEPLFKDKDIHFSGYGDITSEISGYDFIVFFYLIPFNPDVNELSAEIRDFRNRIGLILERLKQESQMIIFTLEKLFYQKFTDNEHILNSSINQFNNYLFELSENNPKIKIIDLSEFLGSVTNIPLVDWKYYYTSGSILNLKLRNQFSAWFQKKLNSISLIRKKCIILDLDNTLWGGIIGEDGLEGIKIGNTYPGSAFLDFQRNLKIASESGVILAVCSKNNPQDVFEAWEKSPNMILKKDNFASIRLNWKNKVSNILSIAEELNIGPDSFVFLDDNPSEREFVRNSLPEVSVPEFPEHPYLLNQFFKDVYFDYFRTYSITEEDRNKEIQYKLVSKSRDFLHSFDSYEEYLRKLELKAELQFANSFNIPRIAQMTQKTNQFNLTTRRYTESDIYKFVSNGDMAACLSVRDKFGDYGITGLIIIKISDDKACIDTLLLSCRILGKGFEQLLLSLALNEIFDTGIKNIYSEYIPTPKNAQTENFYENFGFQLIDYSVGIKKYKLELSKKFDIKNYYDYRILK